jgi:hypothetical protein
VRSRLHGSRRRLPDEAEWPDRNSAITTYTYDPLDRLRMVDYGSNTRIRFRYLPTRERRPGPR